jgi:hypothetical protein
MIPKHSNRTRMPRIRDVRTIFIRVIRVLPEALDGFCFAPLSRSAYSSGIGALEIVL